MSFTYGFFNSKNGDRKYDARQISTMFDGLIEDGVFAHIGNKLAVIATPGPSDPGINNAIKIDTGKAWFNSTWILNDTILTLGLGEPELILYRYDAICIQVSPTQERLAKPIVIQGTPSSVLASTVKPTVPSTHWHILAYVLRRPDAFTPTQADIQNVVGTSECPYITSVLTSVSIDTMIAQWQAQWTTYTGTQQQQFDQWFVAMKAQLSADAAGHLQLQVNELNDAMAGKEISTFGNFAGYMKWSGFVTAANGKSYGVPFSINTVLELDTGRYEPTDVYTSTFGNLVGPYKYVGGALAPNGKIYCAPYEATNIGVIDPVAKTLTTIGTVAAGFAKYSGAVLAPNGKIYFVPLSATAVLVFDPTAGTTTTFGALGTGNKWAGGVLANNGKIYCIPYSGQTILVINPTNNTTTTIASSGDYGRWYGGVLATNGHIIGVPYGASSILDIDPTNNTYTTYGTGRMTVSDSKYTLGVLAPNGKIYCAPTKAAKVLEIDPVTKVVSEIGQDLGAAADKWLGLIYSKNCIYGCPATATTILKIKDVMTIGERAKAIDTRVGDPQQLKVINRSSVVAGTNEVIDSNRSGWSRLQEFDMFSYVSAAAPNFVVKTYDISDNSWLDLSNRLSVGMKIRLVQAGVTKYFFIVDIGGDRITLYGGTDYVLTSAAIDYNSIYFSVVKSPHGFPLNPNKWSIKVVNNDSSDIYSTTNSTQQYPGVEITIPKGDWNFEFTANANVGVIGGSGLTSSAVTVNIKDSVNTSYPELRARIGMFSITDVTDRHVDWSISMNSFITISKPSEKFTVWADPLQAGISTSLQGYYQPIILKAICAYL